MLALAVSILLAAPRAAPAQTEEIGQAADPPQTQAAAQVVSSETVPRQTIRLTMERVVERRVGEFLDGLTPRRVSWRGGLVGLGVYLPSAGWLGWGLKVPPAYLFPSARVGGSLNVDPLTGRSYFGH